VCGSEPGLSLIATGEIVHNPSQLREPKPASPDKHRPPSEPKKRSPQENIPALRSSPPWALMRLIASSTWSTRRIRTAASLPEYAYEYSILISASPSIFAIS